MVAHLEADLFVADIELGAEFGLLEGFDHLRGVRIAVAGDRRHHHLHRRQPQRQAAGVMLEQDADEALHRAEDGAMQHHRAVPRPVLADVRGVEALGQDEIDLQGAQLPIPADGVAQHEFELRPVKGALAGVELVFEAAGVHRRLERPFRPVPDLVGADPHIRAVGEVHDHVGEAEILVNADQKVAEVLGLRRDLVLGAEDMGVVLGEGPGPHQPMERARGLVAVA